MAEVVFNKKGGPYEHLSADGVIRKCNAPSEEACRAGSSTEVASTPVPSGMTKKEKTDWAEKENAGRYAEEALASRKKGDSQKAKSSPKSRPAHNFVEPEIKEIEGYLGSKGWAGAKSGFSYKMSEVAKAIRGDIKEAMRAGYLPKDIKVSIRSRDNAIDGIVDFGSANDDYMYELSTNYGTDYVAAYKLRSDYQKTINKVQAIVDNYNYNSSNSQVDYFNRGFYGNVRELARRERALNRLDSLTKKKKRLRKEGAFDAIVAAELNDALYDYRVETEVDKRVHRTLEDASTFRGHPALRPVSPERLIQLVNRQAIRKEVLAEYQSRY